MSNLVVSKHGYCRMRERIGGGRQAADRISARAYEKGIRPEDARGRLLQYMLSQETAYTEEGIIIRIYGDMIYFFRDKGTVILLITVYRLPNDLVQKACALQRRA